jgi:hypothetical protein
MHACGQKSEVNIKSGIETHAVLLFNSLVGQASTVGNNQGDQPQHKIAKFYEGCLR